MIHRNFQRASMFALSALAALGAACSPSAQRETPPGDVGVSGASGGLVGTSGSGPTTSGGAPGLGGSPGIIPTPGTAGSGGMESCATQNAEATIMRQPVDVILVIDNSGSMQDEIDAVERAINVNFASILAASGVDYRVILLSRHEKANRQTSICVLAPLSGNTTCPPTPDQPAFSDRFFQYSLKVDSTDSLVLLLDTFNATVKDEFALAPAGWSLWLRPEAKKVFLEITDDNSADMSADEFESQLFALSPGSFGSAASRKYTFHSIIGIAEKAVVTDAWLPTEPVQTAICTGNNDTVENPGPVYQELSRRSGGLRFPLCQFTAFDTVFSAIANNVASHAGISCEFPVPPAPQGRELDLSKVAVAYDSGDGNPPKVFGQAMSADVCVPDAFYIDRATQTIRLCPEACTSVQNGLKPSIEVLFTCAPTFVPPPR